MKTFWETNTYFYILEKPLQKEYVEAFSIATRVLYPKEMRTFKLALRSMTDQVNAITSLSPYLE